MRRLALPRPHPKPKPKACSGSESSNVAASSVFPEKGHCYPAISSVYSALTPVPHRRNSPPSRLFRSRSEPTQAQPFTGSPARPRRLPLMAHSRSLSAFARFLLLPMCALLLLLGAISAPAHAQNVTFAGAQTTVPASGLYYPFGAAVDAAGDVFITDSGNNRVVEVPASGGPQTTVPASGLNYPIGVAVDGAGDVFIGDAANRRVVEVPASGGPQTTVPASGLSSPYGVAVDGAGDVFIADHVNNLVVEVPASG